MQLSVPRALEFDRIVEMLQSFAVTPHGRVALGTLTPEQKEDAVRAALATTTEGVRYLDSGLGFPLRGSDDLLEVIDEITRGHAPLEGRQLLTIADFLRSIEEARDGISRLAPADVPILHGLAKQVARFQGETNAIKKAIEPSGQVADDASASLKQIRGRLRTERARLRNTLETYLHNHETSRYLQEQIVTDRNGRYVLVVKAEHRSTIRGIVHGSSASGASVFLEPLETLEINNDIVALEEAEATEVRRILLELTDGLRSRLPEFARTVKAATELDGVQAKARLAQLMAAVEPDISADRLSLIGARHPLLLRRVRERLDSEHTDDAARTSTDDAVPVDIRMQSNESVLLITGPNTGGKTVALKTAGLLALMAQSGLHIPVDRGSVLPVFRSLFADIGDEQSIAASLSTFSGHVTNIAAMDRDLALPALVLLDEIGGGTDPTEGAALGMAILEHFRARGALVIATTHHDALKSYASTTAGVVSAACAFELETFTPKYRLIYGAPGRSYALEIASRLGLKPEVIEAARRYRDTRETQLSDHLARIDEQLTTIQRERETLADERQSIQEREERCRIREDGIRERERVFKQRLDTRLDERVRSAWQEIDQVIDDLKKRSGTLVQKVKDGERRPVTTGDRGTARAEARASVQSIVDRVRETDVDQMPRAELKRSPIVGDRVTFTRLHLEGIVRTIQNDEAEVDVNGKRIRASFLDLRILGAGATGSSRRPVGVQVTPREPSTELNVVGCTVDEALARTEKFLDDAILSELRTVRVIHGHGTGQLRRAIGEMLKSHPYVARHTQGAPDQGGAGVTVVEMKE